MCNALFLMAYYNRLIEQYIFPLQYTRNWILYDADKYFEKPLFIEPPPPEPEEPPAQITMDLPAVPEPIPATPVQQIPIEAPDTFGFELVDALSEKEE